MEEVPRLEITVNGKTTEARLYDDNSSTNPSRKEFASFEPEEAEIIITMLIDQLKFLINDQIFAGDDETRKAASKFLQKLIEQLGTYLYSTLFLSEVKEILHDALQASKFLRIELEFDKNSKKYANWPWEYLYKPEDNKSGGGFFLSRVSQGIVIRKRPTKGTIVGVPKPMVLLIISDPRGYAVECGKLTTTLNDLKGKGYIDLDIIDQHTTDNDGGWPVPIASKEKLKSWLHGKAFDIIHFVGHGVCNSSEGASIALNDRNKDAEWITGRDFATWIGAQKPKLVFLQACETALSDFEHNIQSTALELVEKEIPAVIAMQYKVRDDVATNFAAKFYETLIRERKTVDMAVKDGREAIDGHPDPLVSLSFGLPVLYLSNYSSIIVQENVEREKDKGQNQLMGTNPRQGAPTSLGAQASEAEPRFCPGSGCNTPFLLGVDRFCDKCGYDFAWFCPNCGQRRKRIESNLCNKCRTKLWPLQQDSSVVSNNRTPSSDGIISQSSPEQSKAKDNPIDPLGPKVSAPPLH